MTDIFTIPGPGAEAHLLDDEGHISLMTRRVREILAELRERAGL